MGSKTKDGSLAQSVEQLAFNQLVEGSNPSRPTTSFLLNKNVLGSKAKHGSLAQSLSFMKLGQLDFNQLIEG